MKLNEIIEIFLKGLDDVLMSLGLGGNKYQIQETKFIDTKDLQSIIDDQNIVLWGKIEKKQGMVWVSLKTDDVRTLVGSMEGTTPEEVNKSVMNTLKDLGDAFLGGGLSSLAQSVKKGVIQFESTGILKGDAIFDGSFYSQIQEPILYSSVMVQGSVRFSFPWLILLDDVLKRWFPIDEGDIGVDENSMLTQKEMEAFTNNKLPKTETKKIEEKPTGARSVDTKSKVSNYRNLDVILDIQVEATARLGSVEMPLATVLSLGPGSIINVGHEVDSPIELYVNNKLIAKGDVVIVDEKFGIRITEIVSPQERIESLQ